MRLLDRLLIRYRDTSAYYYEGMASGAAVLYDFTPDTNREKVPADLVRRAAEQYQANPVFWSCVLARMALLSEAVFKFRSLIDKHLFGNDTLTILEYPWPNATAGELWSWMELDVSLAGNAYIWKAADDRLVRIPPVEMTIVSEDTTDPGGRTYKNILGYAWQPDPLPPAGQKPPPQFFEVDEIAHWSPYPDPTAKFRGQSWARAAQIEMQADFAMTQYKTKYMDHGHPITAIRYPAKLRPDTIDFVSERIAAKYGGVYNAWRPLVLDNGADPIMGKGLDELDLRNVQAGGEERICAAAGVPPILVGLMSANTGETYQQAMRRFGDMTIRPLWRSACAVLQKHVPNVSAASQLWFDTSDIAALQAAETEKAQVIQVHAAAMLTLIQAGFTRDSVIAAATSGDLSLLVAHPDAPTPGVVERETVNVADMGPPVTGPESGNNANSTAINRPPRTGTPPGGGQVLTQPQTAATKRPMPASIPTMPSALPGRRPSPNGKGK